MRLPHLQPAILLSSQNENCCLIVIHQVFDCVDVATQNRLCNICRAITDPEPYDFWWRPKQKAIIMKIAVFRDYNKPFCDSMVPDFLIVSVAKTDKEIWDDLAVRP